MSDSTHRVVFAGKPLPGVDRDTAIGNFAQLLKRTPEQVAAAFSGKPTVLKKGLSAADAEKYCRALEKAGLAVTVESEAPAPAASPSLSLSLAPTDDEPVRAAAPAPAPAPVVAAPKISASLALVDDEPKHEESAASPAAQKNSATMTCPACGHQQAKAEVCEACHVVIAKFLARKAEKEKQEAERAAREAAAATEVVEEQPAEAKPSLLSRLFGKK